MAWRPYEYLVGGELVFGGGKARGFAYFLTKGLVRFELRQNYIISGRVRFEKSPEQIKGDVLSLLSDGGRNGDKSYMADFSSIQKGELGDFTTGKDGNPYAGYFYFEWYSDDNGRVVYEGSSNEVEIVEPLVFDFPKDHEDNMRELMGDFMANMCEAFGKMGDGVKEK
jgi:hypothetical protein